LNPSRKLLLGGVIAGSLLAGGAIGTLALGTAGAATNTPSTSTPSSSAPSSSPPSNSGTPPQQDWSKAGHQANGITETLLTGDALTKAKAAAEAAVPGATAQRAETDAEGAAYEVHMTKSDGSIVTVKLDSNFNVTKTIDGMG
jgi:hypothetical protein